MRIKNIKLKNFISFEDIDLKLINNNNDKPNLYIIDGINYDGDSDNASNGSGKSALISESIIYNIYGKPLRGTKQKLSLDEMIKYGTNDMSNTVDYIIDNENGQSILNINRSKTIDKSSKIEVAVDNEVITKRTKKLTDNDIRMFINISPEIFSQIITYYKDNVNLLSMNYGQRLEFFKSIIDLTILDEYYNNIKNFKNVNNNILNRLNLNKKNTEEIIEVITENKEKYKKYLYDKLTELNESLNQYKSIVIEDTNDYKNNLNEKNEILNNINNEINNNTSNTRYVRNILDKIKKEMKKIQSLQEAECPTCKQFVSKEYVENINSNYETELKTHEGELNNYLNESKILNDKKISIDKEIALIKEKIDEVEKKNFINKQNIKNVELEINKIQKEIDDSSTHTNDLDKSKYDKRLTGINKAIDIRKNWEILIEYWYNMFAPKSLLRSIIIRKYITILSDIFDSYISKLYNNEIIGQIEIDDDGQIDILLYLDNYVTNYWQMSSGERKRIDIAMMLSLYEFTNYLNPNIPKFLILDEIFDSLDYPGIRAVTETIVDIQKRYGIDIFIISHIPLPIEDIPEDVNVIRIFVTKKDKNSSVKFIEK